MLKVTEKQDTSLSRRIVVIGSCGISLLNFRLQLLQEMQKKNYEVHAIASDNKQVADTLASLGIKFYPILINRHSLSPLKSLRYFLDLYKKIKFIKPDVSLSYTIKPVIYGTIAATLAGVKKKFCLITGLGYVFTAKNAKATIIKGFVCFLYIIAFSFSTKVIFQNEDDRNYLCSLRLIKRKKTDIVNGSGVDLNHFTPQPFPEKLTFLMISRLLPEKGIFEYIEACKRIKKEYPDIRCCLVGYIDNPLAGITEKTLQTWQSYGIEYLGRQNDVRPALSETSVYVLPSYREGTPRSVLEAMAMGRPIITTDTPGCKQTVEDGRNGFLVPIKDSEALYQAMLKFIRNSSLIHCMGELSLAVAQKKFNAYKININMLEIIK